MLDVLKEIYDVHRITTAARHAGSERHDGGISQVFEVRAFKAEGSPEGRGSLFRIPVSDDVSAGILWPSDHPHYPMAGADLMRWKLWSTVLDDALVQAEKSAGDREGYWPYVEYLLGADALDRLLTLYRAADRPDIEAGIPARNRYVEESGHRLSNTGRSYRNQRRGTFLFRCVDCKRVARPADFRYHACSIPQILDLEFQEDYRELASSFVHRADDTGSRFALWRRGTTRAELYTSQGAELDTLDVAGDVEFDDLLALVIDRWGSLSSVQYSTSLYGVDAGSAVAVTISLAEFKRRAARCATFEVTHHRWPDRSGPRTVDAVNSVRIRSTTADQVTTYTRWPRAKLCRIEGNRITFLHDGDGSDVFTCTFPFEI